LIRAIAARISAVGRATSPEAAPDGKDKEGERETMASVSRHGGVVERPRQQGIEEVKMEEKGPRTRAGEKRAAK